MEATVGHIKSHSKPCCPFIFTCKRSKVIGLVQGIWLLLHYWCWALLHVILRYTVFLYCGDPVWSAGQIPTHAPANEVDVGVGQIITLVRAYFILFYVYRCFPYMPIFAPCAWLLEMEVILCIGVTAKWEPLCGYWKSNLVP